MPEYQLPLGREVTALDAFEAADDFTRGYIEAMFFTEANPDNEELADASVSDLSIEAWRKIKTECRAFQHSSAYVAAVGGMADDRDSMAYSFDDDQAGRDFWYTRNGHGVGFWDRAEDVYGSHADALSELAGKFGEVHLCRGDDGKLYLE